MKDKRKIERKDEIMKKIKEKLMRGKKKQGEIRTKKEGQTRKIEQKIEEKRRGKI